MAIKIGINGYGRIGRNVLRALYEGKRQKELEIVALNDLGDAKTNAHLTRYDTVHGKFPGEVKVDGDSMVVNGNRIRVLAERDPAKLPWGDLGVEIVLECTGAPSVILDAIGRNTPSGIVCLAGLSSGQHRIDLDVGAFNRSMVLENDTVFGSVNANRTHYEIAADALARADRDWLSRLVSRRVPLANWAEAFDHRPDDVKVVLDFTL